MYKHRPTNRYGAPVKPRLTSPELRSEFLIERILKKANGKVSYRQYFKLITDISLKYHANSSTASAFLSRFFQRQQNLVMCRNIPLPIMAINAPYTKENSYCVINQKPKLATRNIPRHDIFYLWLDSNNNTKIGITSSNAQSDRIKVCAKSRKTEVKWSVKFSVAHAREIESEVLSRFHDWPYSNGDGWTEFRRLSKLEIESIVDYAIDRGAIKI